MTFYRNHPCEHCRKISFFDSEIIENAPVDCNVTRMEKGDTLFNEGDSARDVFMVKFGSFRYTKTWEDGSRQIVRIVFAGELIGYPALLSEEPYSVSCVAREDATVCRWEGKHFINAVCGNQVLARKIMSYLSRDLRQSRLALLNRSVLSAEKRLAQFVIDLCMNHGRVFRISDLRANVSRKEASEVTGAKPETISRLLHSWEKEGLVELVGKEVVLKDLEKMKGLLSDDAKLSPEGLSSNVGTVWSVLAR